MLFQDSSTVGCREGFSELLFYLIKLIGGYLILLKYLGRRGLFFSVRVSGSSVKPSIENSSWLVCFGTKYHSIANGQLTIVDAIPFFCFLEKSSSSSNKFENDPIMTKNNEIAFDIFSETGIFYAEIRRNCATAKLFVLIVAKVELTLLPGENKRRVEFKLLILDLVNVAYCRIVDLSGLVGDRCDRLESLDQPESWLAVAARLR